MVGKFKTRKIIGYYFSQVVNYFLMSYYAPLPKNKYLQLPKQIIDLHGYTKSESKEIIDNLLAEEKTGHIRLIIGRGLNSSNGPVLPNFIKTYLNSKKINFRQSKILDGGEGALEVFFN